MINVTNFTLVIKNGLYPLARELCKGGCPVGLRRELWSRALSLNTTDSEVRAILLPQWLSTKMAACILVWGAEVISYEIQPIVWETAYNGKYVIVYNGQVSKDVTICDLYLYISLHDCRMWRRLQLMMIISLCLRTLCTRYCIKYLLLISQIKKVFRQPTCVCRYCCVSSMTSQFSLTPTILYSLQWKPTRQVKLSAHCTLCYIPNWLSNSKSWTSPIILFCFRSFWGPSLSDCVSP